MTYEINHEQRRFCRGPFTYEYMAARPENCRWRIRDVNDNAVGSADTEESAKAAVERLNRGGFD